MNNSNNVILKRTGWFHCHLYIITVLGFALAGGTVASIYIFRYIRFWHDAYLYMAHRIHTMVSCFGQSTTNAHASMLANQIYSAYLHGICGPKILR